MESGSSKTGVGVGNALLALTIACGAQTREDGYGVDPGGTSGVAAEEDGSGGEPAPEKLDVPADTTAATPECDDVEGGNCECVLEIHEACDADSDDPFVAMGLGCPGEVEVSVETTGPQSAIAVRSGLGGDGTFAPREGERFTVIGTGFVAELDSQTPSGGWEEVDFPTFCSDDLDGLANNTDVGPLDPVQLPSPIDPRPVGDVDCLDNPSLVGTGDCSNTIGAQWGQGTSANDYVALTIRAQVPPDATSFSFDFAFLTTEYPAYLDSNYNDLFIGWLESAAWTGNISFDEEGSPISLNAAFLEIRDDSGDDPAVAGSCMRHHGGTRWLTTTAGVVPGETIELTLAVIDLSDSILDSFVLLDNFRWGCDPTELPGTVPVG